MYFRGPCAIRTVRAGCFGKNNSSDRGHTTKWLYAGRTQWQLLLFGPSSRRLRFVRPELAWDFDTKLFSLVPYTWKERRREKTKEKTKKNLVVAAVNYRDDDDHASHCVPIVFKRFGIVKIKLTTYLQQNRLVFKFGPLCNIVR